MGFDDSKGARAWGSEWAASRAAVHHCSEGEGMLPGAGACIVEVLDGQLVIRIGRTVPIMYLRGI